MNTTISAKPKNKTILALVGIVVTLIFVLAALTGCGGGSSDGKALFESKCNKCHSLSYANNTSYKTVEDWRPVVDRMAAMTNSISSSDAQAIAEYLASR